MPAFGGGGWVGRRAGARELCFLFQIFFSSHACMLSKNFFLILEKHGSENNSSAALDIKMKNN